MSDDFDDKTQPATPRRRRDARAEGDVARSADLTAAVALAGMLVLLLFFGAALFKAMQRLVAQALATESLSQLDGPALAHSVSAAIALAAGALAPVLIGLVLFAIVINLSQVGLLFAGKKIRPNLSHLNPFSGRSAGLAQTCAAIAMNLLKLGLAGALAYSAVRSRFDEIVGLQQLSFAQIVTAGGGVIYAVALRVGGLLVALSIVDYAQQRFRHERKLRMSKREVSEELKRTDGDPAVKSRRKRVAAALLETRLRADVRGAQVIVIASGVSVAVGYDAGTMPSPRVIAKGSARAAERIRQFAAEAGIAIVERPALAKALARQVDIGQSIPESFYREIAQLIAYAHALRGSGSIGEDPGFSGEAITA
jgi:flagellar biosynthetic protein FlhB